MKSIAVSPEKLLCADVEEHFQLMTDLFVYASVQVRYERARKLYVSNIDAGVARARKKSDVKCNMDSSAGTYSAIQKGGYMIEVWRSDTNFTTLNNT